jgi:tetratricopeptide (TPR) repeat protein
MVGTGIDGAVRYFTLKADAAEVDEDGKHFPGEVLVHLLYRIGRYQDAMEAYEKYLKDQRSPPTAAPTLFELSECAGDFSKLLKLAKEKDDLLQYTAGLVQTAGSQPAD